MAQDEIVLRSDQAGFLVGTKVDLGAEHAKLALLRGIKADSARIIDLLEGQQSAVRGAVRTAATPRVATSSRTAAPVVLVRRDGQPAATPTTGTAGASATAAAAAQARREASRTPSVTGNRQRDERGRYIGSAAPSSGRYGSEASQERGGSGRGAGLWSRMRGQLSKLRGGLGGMGGGNGDNLDPAIAAAHEARNLASPLLRPLRSVFGSAGQGAEQEKAARRVDVPWYRRIFGELRDINQKTERKGLLSRLLGGMGGLLGSIPGVGLLGRGLGGLFGGRAKRDEARRQRRQTLLQRRNERAEAARQRGQAAGAGGGLGKGGKLPAKGLMGLLRKVPVLGALIGGGMALSSLMGWGGQSRDERFNSAGSGVGSLLGGVAGGLLGGPAGALLGSMLGDIVGGKVGDWLATLDWKAIGDRITGAWDVAVAGIKDGFAWIQDKVGDTAKWVQQKSAQVVAAAAPVVQAAGAKLTEVKDAAVIAGGRLVGKLDKGFRHRESFDGIKGGESLAKNGRYTNEEADRIRALKGEGANTSGSLKGGMPLDIRNKIIARAQANGLDPKSMLEIAAVESGGNANAISSTGAIGIYQHTGGTASGLGITNRFDVDQNIEGAMRLAKENAAALTRAGLPVTRDNLYMMHQLGPAAAKELIKGAAQGKRLDELSVGTQSAAGFNVGAGSKTAAQYLATNSRALDSKLGKAVAPPLLTPGAPVATNGSRLPPMASVQTPPTPQVAKDSPKVAMPIGSNQDSRDTPMVIEAPLTQNVSDRGLAHAATGGIGMTAGNR